MVRIAKTAKPTAFKFYAPHARSVSIAGSFNNWDTKGFMAKKDTKGTWSVKVNLKPGKYEYKFFVDGSCLNDPHCTSCIPNSYGSHNCVMEVKK